MRRTIRGATRNASNHRFPIDSAAYLTLDKRGEMTAHRLGLRVTRRIRIRAVKA